MCLLALVYTQTVQKKNQCNDCAQFKSSQDCSNEIIADSCEWVEASGTTPAKCQKKTTTPEEISKTYCQLIEKPEANCASELGCAYLNSACVPFAGCSAYVKTTTAECQAISYFCVSDGTACIEAKECKEYTITTCETTPSISGINKCKWNADAGVCRDYVCSEADTTLSTNDLCSAWLGGCVTRLKGCWTAPLPQCSTYDVDANQCAYVGTDGLCEPDTASTKCKAKDCANAPVSITSDDECKAYQDGCISNGKGCIKATSKPLCSSYSGDNTTCVGYIGSDGVCEGDAAGTKCRTRKCENGAFTTDELCKNYQESCVTNGKSCVAARGTCSSYKGTATTCAVYIGTDGYCKGTSTTTEAACAPKVCDEAPQTNTTNDACGRYQVGCVTTGAGCTTRANLKSCTTYAGDATSCLTKVGSEGNCTWKSGTNCVARNCESASTTLSSNTTCANYFTNCVTTGAGCVASTTCDLTVKQPSCEGTSGCGWQPVCTSNSACNQFTKKSVCLANQARVFVSTDDDGVSTYRSQKCGWSSIGCKDLACSDLTGVAYNNHTSCSNELSSCMSNLVDTCITKYECTRLKGTKATCLGYPGYCTNTDAAVDDTQCKQRACTDNTSATDNQTCDAFLPGCISNGNGCVDYTTACASMVGDQATCNSIYAYKSGTSATDFKTQQCYNTSDAAATTNCFVKQCSSAKGMTNDGGCASFLTGTSCEYDGNGSCVDPAALTTTCGSYTGDATFCENAKVQDKGTKYCFGTTTSGTCLQRVCSQNTTATNDTECDTFLSGCIAKSEGGCETKSARACSAQQGTTTTCQTFTGGLNSTDKVQCARYDSCDKRLCADKTANVDTDCTNYKSTCRFVKSGAACIDQAACTSYNTPDTATTDAAKLSYCSTIKDNSGNLCGFISGSTCAVRTCEQVNNTAWTSKPTCTTYATGCKQAGNICYTPVATCNYSVFEQASPTPAEKLAQCKLYTNSKNKNCTFVSTSATCVEQLTCESLVIQTDAKTCNDFLVDGECQKVLNTGCLTTVAACASYSLTTSLTPQQKKDVCKALKIVDNTANMGEGTAKYNPCSYTTGDICSDYSCADISNPNSQADCTAQQPIGKKCFFYNNACYGKLASGGCATATFPQSATTDTLKSLYCNSLTEDESVFCTLKADKSGCEVNGSTGCAHGLPTATSPATPSWDGDSTATTYVAKYCAAKTDKNKKVQCKAKTDNSDCEAGTCEDITGATKQADCDNHIFGCVFTNGGCKTATLTAAGDCITAKVPFGTDIQAYSPTDKVTYCQKFKLANTVQCTFDAYASPLPTKCMDAPAANSCTSFTALPTSGQLAYCLSQILLDLSKCGYNSGTNTCVAFDCNHIQNPTSQVDCDLAAGSLTCEYYQGTCYNTAKACSAFFVPSSLSTSAEKKKYCDGIPHAKASEKCTYVTGSSCVKKDTCISFDVSSASDAASKLALCNTLTDGSDNKCSYISGGKCVKVDACTTYDGSTTSQGPEANSESTQCPLIKSNVGTNGYPCMGDAANSKKCKAQTCEDNDSSATNCANNASGCVYFNSKCYTKTTCALYSPVGADNTAKQAWCEGITNSSGDKCAWDSGTSLCKDRTCADKSFYTDADCSGYLASCKTNGTKCVPSSDPCTSLNGTQSFCEAMLDDTGKDKCKLTSTLATGSSNCKNRTCYDNVTATSDSECDSFMTNCVTRGTGCIPRDEPCSAYRGTKTQCETFKQYTGLDTNKQPLYTLCSGDATNTETSPCRVRVCGDNTTATDDTTCVAYLSGCVTKGTGCIEATSACSSYKGDQATCAKFKGSSGAKYCWNTAAAIATSSCADKKCSDVAGTDNASCNNGMKPTPTTNNTTPSPLCVYDGTGCVDNTKSCSQFSGTEETCPNYIATDGPCKSTTVGSAKGACAKRVCTEAPNSLVTDADCQKYHSSCYTTGYGCTTIKQCKNLTNSAACKLRPECTWANQCYAAATSCSTYSNTSYSTCVNSKQTDGTLCAWVEATSKCQAQTCEDQPASYTTHDKCKSFSDTCTTTGAGCITRKTCDQYKTPAICKAASVNADGTGRCGWDVQNRCRARACSDTDGATDEVCDAFLTGCVTNGTSCVAGNSCSEFVSAKYCLSSKTGPCLWVAGTCYNYDRCEDALMKTHKDCQAFSGMCTTNGTNCVPITSCALTGTKAACVLGTDGACGWLPTGKCQKFGQCSDAVSTVQDDCQSYGPSCVTDGTACVTIGKCSDYKTQTSCGNAGTDGICFWNATSNTCKLKECTDVQSTTNDACKVITISGGVTCTTNGTNCIPLSTCSSYVEAGCFTGTDGDCTFALPVGATTGTKACRPKQCQDIADGKNNASCSGVITGKQCVSNGVSCIPKAACSSYTVATACNGGGLDGTNPVVCAFTPKSDTDKVNGTCKTFSACADANKDQTACKSNPSCYWSQSGTTTSCVTHTCATFATGADCSPIPSFDRQSFTVCVLQNGTCQAADPGTITDVNKCYTKSAYTYTWNTATSKCEGCSASSTPNSSTNGTTNGTGTDTTTDYGTIISIVSLGLLGFMA